jgi:hypothetical protein
MCRDNSFARRLDDDLDGYTLSLACHRESSWITGFSEKASRLSGLLDPR